MKANHGRQLTEVSYFFRSLEDSMGIQSNQPNYPVPLTLLAVSA